jgi:hypothetical protein
MLKIFIYFCPKINICKCLCTLLQYEGFLVPSSQGNCKFFVQLETKAACSVRSLVRRERGNCGVFDSTTGVIYNLMPLKAANDSFYTVLSKGGLFKVRSSMLVIYISKCNVFLMYRTFLVLFLHYFQRMCSLACVCVRVLHCFSVN